ncbi:hypothetical protein [Actinoplanes sp. NPDC051851]|uniref:hypothetical protein n=1 Tax=Actinoplanes sp. NPDC051851 TaxID=3154753 RepID=UPI0034495428
MALVLATSLSASLSASPASASQASTSTALAGSSAFAVDDPTCSWSGRVSVDQRNTLFPESHAAYWALPFPYHPDLSITITGEFPASRFMSLSVYKGEGGAFSVNEVESTITDYEILPDAGTVNPWRSSGTPGTYTIQMLAQPTAGVANTLPLAPDDAIDGTSQRLVFRIYLPDGDDFDTVPMPQITLHRDSGDFTLPLCSSVSTALDEADADETTADDDVAAAADPGIRFYRPTGDFGILPNTDTGYMIAKMTPPTGDQVLVVRGRAPTSADGSTPQVWPRRGVQLRYWSICTNLDTAVRPLVANTLPDGTVDYGCRNDDEAILDRHGYYTFVVGTEAQRARIEAIPGATFVPWSQDRPATQHIIFFRNMLANTQFAEAIQNITTLDDPDASAAVMRDYYPEDALCDLTTLEAHHGTCGCL